MKKIELNIIALANSESSKGNFVLILEENRGFRRLAIIIGPFEAQAIAVPLENMLPNRPMTHDLFVNMIKTSNISIKEVIISKVENDIYYATIVGKNPDNTPFTLDARTSDAMALAVRIDCPIYTTDDILSNHGIVLDSPSKAFTNKRGSLTEYSMEELENLLALVLAKEDYESAGKIRDAMKNKNK